MGRVVAVGSSVPTDVPDVVPEQLMGAPVKLTVFMRRVGVFSRIGAAANPSECVGMRVARAGHTATLLADGRVFIAGGFNFKPDSKERAALADVEIFNPNTGTFELPKSARMESQGMVFYKAYHTATYLERGQVLLWGGEQYAFGQMNVPVPVQQVAALFDVATESFGTVPARKSPPNVSRSRHVAVLDPSGHVLIAGGLTRKNDTTVPAEEVEWYHLNPSQLRVIPNVKLPRDGAVAGAVNNSTGAPFVAVAGGSNGSVMAMELSFFKLSDDAFTQMPIAPPARLADPGRRGAAAALLDETKMILLGGWGDASASVPLMTSEVVGVGTVAVGPNLDAPRAESCAVSLGAGTRAVFAVGGLTRDAEGQPLRSDDRSQLIQGSPSGMASIVAGPTLARSRYAHTCTALADGSVLVLGGLERSVSGAEDVLQDAWIYTPAPTND